MLKLTPTITQIKTLPNGPYSKQDAFCYLIQKNKECVLIDTGTGHKLFQNDLKQALSNNGQVTAMLLTHNHGNHVRGLDRFLGDLVGAPITTKLVQVIKTPGHSDDHVCFYYPDEESLFSGDAIFARPSASKFTKCLYSNLNEFRISLKKLETIGPRLIFPGHGTMTWNGVEPIQQARDILDQIDSSILEIIGDGIQSTQKIIDIFQKKHQIPNAADQFILKGALRLHLQDLVQRNNLVRTQTVFDTVGKADANMKGPGGLTMTQIHQAIKKSQSMDWEKDKSVRKVNLHPCHAHIDGTDFAFALN